MAESKVSSNAGNLNFGLNTSYLCCFLPKESLICKFISLWAIFSMGSGITQVLVFEGQDVYQLNHLLSPWEFICDLHHTYIFFFLFVFYTSKNNLEKFHS